MTDKIIPFPRSEPLQDDLYGSSRIIPSDPPRRASSDPYDDPHDNGDQWVRIHIQPPPPPEPGLGAGLVVFIICFLITLACLKVIFS